MTLHTKMYVHDQVDVHDFFRGVQFLLGQLDEHRRGPDQQETEDKASFMDETARSLANSPGQGLPAWIWVDYQTDAPLRAEDEHYEWCEDDDDCYNEPELPACWVELNMDTAYGYKGPGGMGCGDLHALMLEQIGMILDSMSIGWSWRNEFTGEIHQGHDNLDGLGSGGAEAAEWVRSKVIPALGMMQAGEMG